MYKIIIVLLCFYLSACKGDGVGPLDDQPPIIRLIGVSTLSLTQGENYLDAGALVTDNVDKTVAIIVDNSVNTNVVGTYYVTYTASDDANNQATPVIRTIIITPKVSVTVAQGMKSLISLLTSDELLRGGYIIEIIDPPTKGVIELDNHKGLISYTSNNIIGIDSFIYKATSTNIGGESFTATTSIKIIPKSVMLNTNELLSFSSNLPIVIIDTLTNIPENPKIKGLLTVIPINLLTGRSNLNENPEYSGFMEIDIRGSTSLDYPKKQYGVDTETLSGNDNNISLLGMPKEHKWILHAPYSDKSLMRNYLAYNKTRALGGYTAVRTKYVELLMRLDDGTYRYDGVYVFMEKIKRDKNRVNIKKLKPSHVDAPSITGGYIMRQDRDKEDWFFYSNKGSKIVLEYPKTKNLNIEQKEYILTYMNSFENALYSQDFNNIHHENYYGNFINVDSFIKHLLSREFFRDVDTWRLSEFFNKQREGNLFMSPVWDFNLGMGNSNFGYKGVTTGWHYNDFNNKNEGIGGIMSRLMSDPLFKNKVAETWDTMRNGDWSDANLKLFIENTKNLLRESQARNFLRWPVLGSYVWPNRVNVCTGSGYCDTWDKAVDEHLKAWLLARAHWIDKDFL